MMESTHTQQNIQSHIELEEQVSLAFQHLFQHITDSEFEQLKIHNLTFYFAGLTSIEKRVITKLQQSFQDFHLLESLSTEPDDLLQAKLLHQTEAKAFTRLQKKLVDELLELSTSLTAGKAYQAQRFIYLQEQLTSASLEQELIQALQRFIQNLQPQQRRIFKSRLGYQHTKEPLKQLAAEYKITGEGVRRQTLQLHDEFKQSLRVTSQSLWLHVEPLLTYSFKESFPELYQAFVTEKDFFRFFEILVDRTHLFERVYPQLTLSLLDPLFASTPEPISYQDCIQYLEEHHSQDFLDLDNVLALMEHKGWLDRVEHQMLPRALSKTVAISHYLANEPEGLHWSEIAHGINQKRYTRTKFQEKRGEDVSYRSEHTYLYGIGCYRHTRFLDKSREEIEWLFTLIRDMFEKYRKTSMNLTSLYQEIPDLNALNYYDVRYWIDQYGESMGLYFHGICAVDTVSLDKNAPLVSQEQVILDCVLASDVPLSAAELTQEVRSGSVAHANSYLSALASQGKLVALGGRTYASLEVAFQGVDYLKAVEYIHGLVQNTQKPIDSSMIDALLTARQFKVPESSACFLTAQALYTGLIGYAVSQYGWYRRYSLLSSEPIAVQSIWGLVEGSFQQNLPEEENIKALKTQVLITTERAQSLYERWSIKKGS